MDGMKKLFMVMIVFGPVVPLFMLVTFSGIQPYTEFGSRNASALHFFKGTKSGHVEVSPHPSSNDAISVTRTAGTNLTRTTRARGDVTAAKGSRADTGQRSGRCRYRIQVYDDQETLTKHRPVLQSVVKQSAGRRRVRTNVSCGLFECDVEVTISPGDRYLGMDAVVFHFMKNLIPNPVPRADVNPNQTWIYFTWESPRSNAAESGRLANLPVHATWTYHRASDVTLPYGFYKPGLPMANRTRSVEDWLKGKTKPLAWMASNCVGTFWPRMKFVKELQKHIPVDIYGACGNLTCRPAHSTKCTVDLLRQYKFYLSLENAECDDYITEKLWNKPLMQGVVPIVYGPRRQIYEELLPPNSFIFIGDFNSIKELADHLRILDSRPDLYIKYLEWQYKGSVGTPKQMHGTYEPTIFCSLIPVIQKVQRGELSRTPVKTSNFSKSCRKVEKSKTDAGFGLGKWSPW